MFNATDFGLVCGSAAEFFETYYSEHFDREILRCKLQVFPRFFWRRCAQGITCGQLWRSNIQRHYEDVDMDFWRPLRPNWWNLLGLFLYSPQGTAWLPRPPILTQICFTFIAVVWAAWSQICFVVLCPLRYSKRPSAMAMILVGKLLEGAC